MHDPRSTDYANNDGASTSYNYDYASKDQWDAHGSYGAAIGSSMDATTRQSVGANFYLESASYTQDNFAAMTTASSLVLPVGGAKSRRLMPTGREANGQAIVENFAPHVIGASIDN